MFITRRACVNSNSKYIYIHAWCGVVLCDEGVRTTNHLPANIYLLYMYSSILCLYNPKLMYVSEHDDDDYDIISFIYNTTYVFLFWFLLKYFRVGKRLISSRVTRGK